ncbi:MAG: transporter substrate-binding domain-containing protein [Desulfobacterales bacterium]|nr:transporter substrate-binding domain-containing protein [Desulfobacterales bacterium]
MATYWKCFGYVLLSIFLCFGIPAAAGLRILSTEEPPTNYTLNGKFTGTTTDIVQALKQQLGETAAIENRPWANAYKIAQEQPGILVFTCGKTQSRIDHGFQFVGPVITRKHVLWKKAETTCYVSTMADIRHRGLRVGGMRGDWRTKYFTDRGIPVDLVPRHANNVKKLFRDRIDLWISSDLEAPGLLQAEGRVMADIEIAFVIREAASFLMFSRDTPKETVRSWAGAYAELQETDFFEKASAKWSLILGFDLGYQNDLGFYIKSFQCP